MKIMMKRILNLTLLLTMCLGHIPVMAEETEHTEENTETASEVTSAPDDEAETILEEQGINAEPEKENKQEYQTEEETEEIIEPKQNSENTDVLDNDTIENLPLIDEPEVSAEDEMPMPDDDVKIVFEKGNVRRCEDLGYFRMPNAVSHTIMARYEIGSHPVYCIEPTVGLGVNQDFIGPEYIPSVWEELDEERRMLCKRIAFYGYGHPMSSDQPEAYTATQLLIWKVVCPDIYDAIYNSFIYMKGDRHRVATLMSNIMVLVNGYNAVPSFADRWGRDVHHAVTLNEELLLTDTDDVLTWFESLPEQVFDGIEAYAEENHLHIKVTDPGMFLNGNNNVTLLFRRKKEQWTEMTQGLVLYSSPGSQKLIAESHVDPVNHYYVSLSLKTGTIELQKTDSHGKVNPYCEGAVFEIGYTHAPGEKAADPETALDGQNLKYPVTGIDGNPLQYVTGPDGKVTFRDLPANERYWLKETGADQVFHVTSVPQLTDTVKSDEVLKTAFANPLQEYELRIVKQDEEDARILIDDAKIEIYEIGDLSNTVYSGVYEPVQEETIPFHILKSHSSLKIADTFAYNGATYRIIAIDGDVYTLEKAESEECFGNARISRYTLPEQLQEKQIFDYEKIIGYEDGEIPITELWSAEAEFISDTHVLLKMNKDDITVYESVAFTDAELQWEDMPALDTLTEGMHFTKKFRDTVVDYEIKDINNRHITIGFDNTDCIVEIPPILSVSSVPENGMHDDFYTLLEILDPEYILKDSRDNIYQVKKKGTKLLHSEENSGSILDITYNDLQFSGLVPSAQGYEPGSVFHKDVNIGKIYAYTGVQFSALTDEMKATQAGEVFTADNRKGQPTEFTVLEALKAGKMKLSYMEDNILLHVTLKENLTTIFAESIEMQDTEFTILKRKDRRFVVKHEDETELYPVYTLSKQPEDMPTWDDFKDNVLGEGFTYIAPDGIEWMVLESDKTAALIDSEDGRYWISEAGIHSNAPLSWEKFSALENSEILQIGGTYSFKSEHPISEGDIFEKNGRSFYVDQIEKNDQNMKSITLTTSIQKNVQLDDQFSMDNQQLNFMTFTIGKNEEKLPVYVTSKKNNDLLWTDVEAARRKKMIGDTITLNGEVYSVVKFEITENGSEVTLENKNREFVIHESYGDEPMSYQRYLMALKDLNHGAVLEINGVKYTIESYANGMLVLRDGAKKVTVKNSEAIVPLRVCLPGKTYDLTEWIEGESFEFATVEGHCQLDNTSVYSDTETVAKVVGKNKDGIICSHITLLFSSSYPEGILDGKTVFQGYTGHSYARLTDTNQNALISREIALYSDAKLQKNAGTCVTDSVGISNTDRLNAGLYYYQDPVSNTVMSINVKNAEEGAIRVSGLKKTHNYLVTETELPDGYDYGKQMPAATFSSIQNEITLPWTNRVRRLKLQVYKVDQDNQMTLLNNAWFSVKDLTYSDGERLSIKNDAISLSDIPRGIETGERIKIWKSAENGKKHIYRIVSFDDNSIDLSMLENGAFTGNIHIRKDEVHPEDPMLYTQTVYMSGGLRKGKVFEFSERVPFDEIETFRIMAQSTGIGKDIFGNAGSEATLNYVVLKNESTGEITEIGNVPAVNTGDAYLGEYLSGGIVTRVLETVPSIPITYEEIEKQVNEAEAGRTLDVEVLKERRLPSFAWVSDQSDQFRFDGTEWEVVLREEKEILIMGYDQLFTLKPEYAESGFRNAEKINMTIVKTERNAQNEITGVIIQSTDGESYYILRGEQPVLRTVGKPGVEVKVYKKGETEPVYTGLTGMDGTFVVENVPDGDYVVAYEQKTEEVHVEKGLVNIPEVRYGHTVEICETKSPLGYLIGDACMVFTPKPSYGTDRVLNHRTNAKVTKIRKIMIEQVRKRKMGNYETE